MDLHNNINLVNKINIGRFLISLKITMKQAMEKYKITKTDYSFTKSLTVIYEEYPNFINFQLSLKKIKDNLKIIKQEIEELGSCEAEHILSPNYTIENNNENNFSDNEQSNGQSPAESDENNSSEKD